jgi:uncharacterized damage-inducible protein DinB
LSTNQAMIQAMYGHSVWANSRLLAQADRLNNDQLDTLVEGGVGTFKETLVHMMAAQLAWLRRFRGEEPIKPPSPDDFPDIASVRVAWSRLDDETIAYVAALTDDDLNEIIHYRSWYGWDRTSPRWEAVLHQAFHQHQHRGELAMMLTQFGHSPGEIDVMDYLDEVVGRSIA